jgi:hypothetical protein
VLVVEPVVDDVALRNLAAAIWRQVARDLTSRSPDVRTTAVAWLMSEAAVTWAIHFDDAIDEPEVVIQAVLVGGRPVRHTRYSARRASSGQFPQVTDTDGEGSDRSRSGCGPPPR